MGLESSAANNFRCSKCSIVKSESSFPHSKRRRHCWCRDSNNADKRRRRSLYRETNPRKKRLTEERFTPDGDLICSKCRKSSPVDETNGSWCNKCRAKNEADKRAEKGVSAKNT